MLSFWPRLALLIVLGLLPTPLAAQNAGPALFGRQDFEMDWVDRQSGKTVRLRFLAERRILRIEALDGSQQAMLHDLQRGAVYVLVAEGQRGVYGREGTPLGNLAVVLGDQTRQIAGETCRDASVGGAQLCLSDDGVPLLVLQGEQQWQAERVLRQPQNPLLFALPKDAKIQPFPGGGRAPGLPF